VRILYFSRGYTPHDYRFLTSLAGAGYEVSFLRLERSGRQIEDRSLPPAVEQLSWRGGSEPFRWRDLPGLLSSLRGVIRRVRPDILHAGPIQTVAFPAALSGFRPLVSMSWGSDLLKDADRSRWYRWVTRYTLRHSTVLVGDNPAVRAKAISFGFPDERVFTFPWGIDLDQFTPSGEGSAQDVPDLRSRLGWQEKFVVLSLRSWEPVYGVDVLLRGFALAAEQAPELRLLLLGGGSQAGLVHRLIQDLGLQQQVYLGGQVRQQDLPRFYQAADLYVSAAHSDGSSVSLMEALGCGLPALVTDIPSNREWVGEGVHGWLFPDNREDVLAERILDAIRNPGLLAAMRLNARARAEAGADWRKNFQELGRAYAAAQQITARRGQAR
jgi:glycosyltransferase involved in cell wall biosynthesis